MADGKQPFVRARTDRQAGRGGRRRPGGALLRPSPRHARPRRRRSSTPRPKIGGLNEYGIAAYKTPGGFAQAEVDFILSIGGIAVEAGKALGRDFTLDELRQDFDAVFLGMGLGGVNALELAGEDVPGVGDAVGYIAELRQAADLSTLPVGRRVVVIGGGMTAIDIAVQSRRLGAEDVTMVYRRGPERMGASQYERELAQTDGVRIKLNARPARLVAEDGQRDGDRVRIHHRARTGELAGTGETFALAADMVFKAIGQNFLPRRSTAPRRRSSWKAAASRSTPKRRTALAGVWAGGDCVAGGEDLTVAAVEDGKIAAESIHRALMHRPARRGRAARRPNRQEDPAMARPADLPNSSASSRPTRSGWPRRRRPTRNTTSSAPSRRAGAAWCGRRWARTRRSSTSTARATARSMPATAG